MGHDEHGPAYPERDTPEMKEATGAAKACWGALLAATLFALILWGPKARGMDHGFNPDDHAVQWFEALKIPPAGMVSCCGAADAYPVDRYERQPDGSYKVWIEDGSAITYPDGTSRIPWDTTVPVIVPPERVNKEDDDLDNPTDHGWLFFVPSHVYGSDGKELPLATVVSEIYCFVRHPQGN